jgi:dTDP-4-dehydrorhamnose 3,5-epimerase
MEFKNTKIQGLIEITPRVIFDDRGYFFESYQYQSFKNHDIPSVFVQDNQSFSKKGVLRGLHLQKPPFSQGKLVRVVSGAVLDIAVDLRKDSPTFGLYESFYLSGENQKMVFIPEGFAHGFYTIEDAVFSYKCTNIYNKDSEIGILWNDKDLNINWQCDEPLISPKDLELLTFSEYLKAI